MLFMYHWGIKELAKAFHGPLSIVPEDSEGLGFQEAKRDKHNVSLYKKGSENSNYSPCRENWVHLLKMILWY